MNKAFKHFCLVCLGGTVYILIEIIWRAIRNSTPTHWTMFILGGIVFLFIGGINEYLPWDMPIWIQCYIGCIIILLLEFIFGCVLNIWLGLNIWDYSNVPFNVLGQICLPYAIAWYFLTAFAIIADDYLRYLFFKEEKPHYNFRFKESK